MSPINKVVGKGREPMTIRSKRSLIVPDPSKALKPSISLSIRPILVHLNRKRGSLLPSFQSASQVPLHGAPVLDYGREVQWLTREERFRGFEAVERAGEDVAR